MNLKAVLGYLAIAFAVWWVMENPAAAAHAVHNIGAFLAGTADGLSRYFAEV